MKVLFINAHLTYPGWSEGKLNLTFMDAAKAFFAERGHQVTGTCVERGYSAEAEVEKHAASIAGPAGPALKVEGPMLAGRVERCWHPVTMG